MVDKRGAEWPPPENASGPGEGQPQSRNAVDETWQTWVRPDGSYEMVGPSYPPSEGSQPLGVGPSGHPVPSAPPAIPPPPLQ